MKINKKKSSCGCSVTNDQISSCKIVFLDASALYDKWNSSLSFPQIKPWCCVSCLIIQVCDYRHHASFCWVKTCQYWVFFCDASCRCWMRAEIKSSSVIRQKSVTYITFLHLVVPIDSLLYQCSFLISTFPWTFDWSSAGTSAETALYHLLSAGADASDRSFDRCYRSNHTSSAVHR